LWVWVKSYCNIDSTMSNGHTHFKGVGRKISRWVDNGKKTKPKNSTIKPLSTLSLTCTKMPSCRRPWLIYIENREMGPLLARITTMTEYVHRACRGQCTEGKHGNVSIDFVPVWPDLHWRVGVFLLRTRTGRGQNKPSINMSSAGRTLFWYRSCTVQQTSQVR